jgi:ectoine hydroxylase-related dioxygenase (phytanoyl-CoA dioxygenase family)
VQCTLFEKSPQQNWLVPLHQDLSIAVAEQIEHPEIRGWSQKEGQLYAQPPAALLAQMLAVRLQLDSSGPDDGALRVVPGSHRYGRLRDAQTQALKAELGEVTCMVPQGGVMLMRPLLLHASSKLSSLNLTLNRRVLHFLFGPQQLPFGLKWSKAEAVKGCGTQAQPVATNS